MKIEILSSAMTDLVEGRQFYDKQSEGLGEYFFDSLFSDIDSLTLYAGYPSNVLWLPSDAFKTVPLCNIL